MRNQAQLTIPTCALVASLLVGCAPASDPVSSRTRTYELEPQPPPPAGRAGRDRDRVAADPPPETVAAPIVRSFTAHPAQLRAGESTTLSFDVDGADQVRILGIGPVTQSSLTVTPRSTGVFRLVAVNRGGRAEATVRVSVRCPNCSEATPTTLVIVDPNHVVHNHAKKLLGASFDARSSFDMTGHRGTPAGYHDATGAPRPEVAPLWSQVPATTFRYPGTTVNRFDWKETIGASRPRSALGGPGGQVFAFGFDEFMQMAQARGVLGSEVQIMVNIYPTHSAPDPVQNAADWVEYANATNDGSNPGGGVDWAAVRAINGHPAPYAVGIWNVGNEPWSRAEFDFDGAAYAETAAPIIAAMTAIDPSIRITLPAAGAPTMDTVNGRRTQLAMNAWDAHLIARFGHEVYGLSQHLFYDESEIRGVTAALASIDLLADQIATSGTPLRHLIGDHAHSIALSASGAPTSPPDYAMQAQAALTNAALISSLTGRDIERANFWVYGNTAATWHPIRRNGDGTYTLMAAARMQALLGEVMSDHALEVSCRAPASSDDVPAIVSSAFSTPQGVSVVIVNRDPSVDHVIQLDGLRSHRLIRARRVGFTDPAADTLDESEFGAPQTETIFELGANSMLVLELRRR